MNEHLQGVFFSAYIDQELAREERAGFESHIRMCEDCRQELERLKATKLALSKAPRRALPPDLLENLESQLSRRTWLDSLREIWELPQMRVAAQATAAAAIVLSVWFGAKGFYPDEGLPLEPLLAAHSRYAAEGLVPPGDLVASNFSAQLAVYHAE